MRLLAGSGSVLLRIAGPVKSLTDSLPHILRVNVVSRRRMVRWKACQYLMDCP